MAEFRGLSWDGLETPVTAAQPSVTLRRLVTEGAALEGYFWIKGQTEGGVAINTNVPPDADATAIVQQAPFSGEKLHLHEDCSLESPDFTPVYPSSNKIDIEVVSTTNSFQRAKSESLLMEFRDFDIDYTPVTDWFFPVNDDPTSVPEENRTLSVVGGDLFDWSSFTYGFNGATTLSIEGGMWGENGLLLGWPVGGLVIGDTGSVYVTLQYPEFGETTYTPQGGTKLSPSISKSSDLFGLGIMVSRATGCVGTNMFVQN